MTSRTIVTIKEHEALVPGTGTDLKENRKQLTKKDFEQLKDFIFSSAAQNGSDEEENNSDLYLGYTKNSRQETIKAKHYVGAILLKSGTTIEILPKTADEKDNGKQILLNMLSTLTKTPFVKSGTANLDTDRLPIFEYFIRMFIDEVLRLQKCGFRSKYIEQQSNELFFKGKLLITEHIKHNFAHAERFYIQYDDYNLNRPLNRLIKATLQLLLKKTNDWNNKKDIQRLLDILEPIQASVNYELDIARVDIDRNMIEFRQVFEWCKIFLRKKSFTSFAGESSATALLFDMNRLFESYVAAKLKKYNPDLSAQDTGKYLFDEQNGDSKKFFSLRPDLVIGKRSGNPLILDTKWKLLDNNRNKNYGISVHDMYQMYVYHKKYSARKVVLIYPKTKDFSADVNEAQIWYGANEKEQGNIKVEIRFVDLTWDDNDWKTFSQSLG